MGRGGVEPHSVVLDDQTEPARTPVEQDADRPRPRMLRGIVQRFLGEAIDGDLVERRQLLPGHLAQVDVDGHLMGPRHVLGELAEAGGEPEVVEHRGVETLGDAAEVGEDLRGDPAQPLGLAVAALFF